MSTEFHGSNGGTEFGCVEISEPMGGTVEISTANWPECSQEATMTRAQFAEFVKKCHAILTAWPKEETR